MNEFKFDPNFSRPSSPVVAPEKDPAVNAATGDQISDNIPGDGQDVISMNDQTRVDRARYFFENRRWGDLWQLKQHAKYGWDKLGFTSKEADRIKINKPDWI